MLFLLFLFRLAVLLTLFVGYGCGQDIQFPGDFRPLAWSSLTSRQPVDMPLRVDSATTPLPPNFFACMQNCPTTPEYNPVCGSNRQLYFNEQKFNCATRCGARASIVRKGSCRGLFPMTLG